MADTKFSELIQSDVPSRMLRQHAKLKTRNEKEAAHAWLERSGWRFEINLHGPTYFDPVTGTDWGPDSATRIQMVRAVQPFLQGRGWCAIGKQPVWSYATDPVFKGEHWTKKSERSLINALKDEGVLL